MAAGYRYTPSGDDAPRALQDALARLPEVMRIVLLLNLYDGMRTAEIAHMMECDIRIVRSLRERALRTLEGQLTAKQLAIERACLPGEIRRAFTRMIGQYRPDPDSVARVREQLSQLPAG